MAPSTTVGKLIADLYERGVERDEIAKRLKIQGATISCVKNGRGSFNDDKLGILAEMHGGVTEKELKVRKYLEWLESEKGISLDDILEVTAPESSRKKRPKKVA